MGIEQINFVVGDCGSVVESDFYTKLRQLGVQEGKKDKLFAAADYVTQVCEAHDRVILSFLQQVQGFARPTTERSREKIFSTMCTFKGMYRGTHAHRASKMGLVER